MTAVSPASSPEEREGGHPDQERVDAPAAGQPQGAVQRFLVQSRQARHRVDRGPEQLVQAREREVGLRGDARAPEHLDATLGRFVVEPVHQRGLAHAGLAAHHERRTGPALGRGEQPRQYGAVVGAPVEHARHASGPVLAPTMTRPGRVALSGAGHGALTRQVQPPMATSRPESSVTRGLHDHAAPAGLHHLAGAGERAVRQSGGPQVADVQLGGDVAGPDREQRVDGTPHRGVDEGGEHAAVDEAEGVQVELRGDHREGDPAGLGLDGADVEGPERRWQRELLPADGLQDGEPVVGAGRGDRRRLVLPRVGPMTRRG